MSKAFFDLPSRIEDGFAEIDSDIMIDLRDTNEEYAILQKQLSELKQQHPFIDKIMEGDGAINLTADEHDVFFAVSPFICYSDFSPFSIHSAS